jgi:CheY-like chemotaxis protein
MFIEAGGMDDYLAKPLDVAALTAALGRWVSTEAVVAS